MEFDDEMNWELPCELDDEDQKDLRVDKIWKKRLHTSQVTSKYNLRGKSKTTPKSLVDDYCKFEKAFSVRAWNAKHNNHCDIKEAAVLVCAWDAKQNNCVEIKETSVSVRRRNPKQQKCADIKDASASPCSWNAFRELSFDEHPKASVSVRAQNAKQQKCGEIKEASASICSLNAFRDLNLDEHRVFTKLMCKTHVRGGFFLAIPTPFSRRHLPKVDTMMTLETDIGEEYDAKYLRVHSGLSGGWRGFALDKKLLEEDLVVFHLIKPTRFKVYIIRKNSSIVKLPAAILNLCSKATETVPDKKQLIVYKRRKARQTGENSNKKSEPHFSNITGFKEFSTIMSELLQNHELPEATLRAYYELCRAQNAFLHANLLKGLNIRFFVGAIRSIICKTVDVAGALRTCTRSTFLDHLSQWNKTLHYHKALGMNVSLLHARVHHLRNLALNSDGAVNGSRYMEACCECPRAEFEVKKLEIVLAKLRKISILLADEIKTLDSNADRVKYLEKHSKLIQVEDEIRKLQVLLSEFDKFFEHYHAVIENLKLKVNNHDRQFQEEASAPW